MSAVREAIGVLKTVETLLDHTPVAAILATSSTLMDILVMVQKSMTKVDYQSDNHYCFITEQILMNVH